MICSEQSPLSRLFRIMNATCARPGSFHEAVDGRCWFLTSKSIRLLRGRLTGPLTLACLSFAIAALSADQPRQPVNDPNADVDLTQFSLPELMNVEVTTGARHLEKLSQSPAAISVITQEDIRRSGVTTLPEALRLAPGLEVARVDASQWAISARGFNDVFANKLLVLQDGRTLYTPLFSGVFWDVQTTMLDDIDRIEVIRGPGATLWGANAVDGVINIISKSAKETQGTLISAGGGSEDRGFAAVRFGDKIGENAFFRVYGTYYNRADSDLVTGPEARDDWQIGHFGFRIDWDLAPAHDLITFQGDGYRGSINQLFETFDPANPPTLTTSVRDNITVDGGNMLGKWTHIFAPGSDLTLQAYYDRSERNTIIFSEKRDTFDVDFQDRFNLLERNDIVWGGGYRMTADRVGNSPTISLDPDHRNLQLFSAFGQDEITVIPEHLRFTIGSKFEHNDFTGFEIQPAGRILWTPHEQHTVWASVSRAVRTPSRSEADVILNRAAEVAPGLFVPTTIHGSDAFDSEKLLAYELGYRSQVHPKVSVDIAAFYNEYDELRSLEADRTNPTQFTLGNKLYGDTYGGEISGTLKLADWWRLKPAYTLLKMDLHKRASSTDTTSLPDEGKSPQQQFTLRSQMELPRNITFDCALRYVDSLPALRIDSYWTLDVRVAWRPVRNLELALGGQNLLQEHHAEFSPSFIQTQRTEVERGVYGKVTWRF
jgi:iron complex outermembrane recepter protein